MKDSHTEGLILDLVFRWGAKGMRLLDPLPPSSLSQLHCCHQVLMCVLVSLPSPPSFWGLPRSPALFALPSECPWDILPKQGVMSRDQLSPGEAILESMRRCLENGLIQPLFPTWRLRPRRDCEVADSLNTWLPDQRPEALHPTRRGLASCLLSAYVGVPLVQTSPRILPSGAPRSLHCPAVQLLV